MTTDLVPAGDNSPYQLLRMERSEVSELLAEALSPGEGLTPRDLVTVKVPAGGLTKWAKQTIRGEEVVDELRGVIIRADTRRAYWRSKYSGGNEEPQCFSDDGLHGIGDPGMACIDCPFNQFLDEPDEAGSISKPCKEMRQVFLLPPDGILPLVVTLPPGSLANFKAYRVGLMGAGLRPAALETVIRLEKAESKGGVKYARATFIAGVDLDVEAQKLVAAYANDLQPAIERVRRTPIDRAAAAA